MRGWGGFGEEGDGVAGLFELGCARVQRGGRDVMLCHQAAVAQREGLVPDTAGHAASRVVAEVTQRGGGGEGENRTLCGFQHRPCQTVLAARLQRRGQMQHSIRIASGRHDVGQPRLALGQRSGLVEGHDPRGVRMLQRGRVADQDPAAGGRTGADHDRGRSRQTQCARTRNHQHRHRIQHRSAWRGTKPQPGSECRQGDHQYHRHEHRADPVGQALHRRFGGLRVLHQPDDLRQHRLRADGSGFNGQQAIGVDRTGRDVGPGAGLDGQALTGQHRVVDPGGALDHTSVHRNALARTDDHHVAGADRIDRHPGFNAVPPQRRGFRSQFHQRAHGRGGLAAGPALQPFAEADEGDQQRRGFEI